MWKTDRIPQIMCGKKVVAALREIPLFHITFLYDCYFYK